MIGRENSRHLLIQSDTKLKPTTTRSPAFSRALAGRLFYLLIGRCANLWFCYYEAFLTYATLCSTFTKFVFFCTGFSRFQGVEQEQCFGQGNNFLCYVQLENS